MNTVEEFHSSSEKKYYWSISFIQQTIYLTLVSHIGNASLSQSHVWPYLPNSIASAIF